MAFQITGITRDNTGNIVGSVEVYLLKYTSGTHLFTQIARTTSDASNGTFSFLGLADNDPAYNIVAFKDGTPHVYDVSDRNIRPILTGGSDPIAIFGSNLLAWWKADTGLTKIGGGVPGDGDQVVQMTDNSGNSLTVTDGGIGGPTYRLTGLNSLPALECINSSGVQHLFTATDAVTLGGQALSVFMVCKVPTTCTNNGRLFAFLGSGDSNDVATTTSAAVMLRDASTNAFTCYRNGNQQATQAMSMATTVHIGMVYDGANTLGGGAAVIPYLNGTAGTPSSVEASDVFDTTGTFGIATQFSPSASFGGDLTFSEVVVVKAAASAAQAASLDTYFTSRGF